LGKPKHWLLPLHACMSVGGDEERALPAVMATACAHISIILVDDMLDADPRGVHVTAGEAGTANMASALQSAACHAISGSDMTLPSKLRAMEAVNAMFLATSLGQYWDVNTVIEDEETYWKIARAKSSPFFSTAFEVGALAGGASLELSAQIKELGVIYGEMIQIHDDLDDTLAVPAKPDWNVGRASLPILFAQGVDHPSRSRFGELRPHASEQLPALEEAQQILIECGAVSYCIHQLLERYDQARELASALPFERRDVMEKVFEDIIQPVLRLLEEAERTT
ncbi:MAG: polyprenyl synthetase family protein, partial [Chloroflexi bacterium]|nr:polyprenyl synthetase family protein [Chloroflexota bacterium]